MCETPERGAHEGGGGLDEDTGPEAAGENPGRGEEEDWVAEAGPDVELRQGRVTPAEYLHRGHQCFKKVHPKVRNHGEGPY